MEYDVPLVIISKTFDWSIFLGISEFAVPQTRIRPNRFYYGLVFLPIKRNI